VRTEEYPTPAKRPRNSRLDLGRWRQVFGQPVLGQSPPHWQSALAPVLDELTQPGN
jgi:dTDP-4-dehydrorhamnose reductase